MTKKQDTARQRLIAAARTTLAAKHAKAIVAGYATKSARLDRAGKRARADAPTAEQAAKAPYVETDVNEYVGGLRVRIGRAWKRQPRFETIEGLAIAELFALRCYRRAFDTSEVSPVKSGLDIGAGGGAGGAVAAIARLEAVAFADIAVQRLEQAVSPNLLPILRAVALHDADFKAVAHDRYGSTSGNRRQQVRGDFLLATRQLTKGVRRVGAAVLPAAQTDAPATPLPSIDPVFLDERGLMRPFDEVAEIIRAGVE